MYRPVVIFLLALNLAVAGGTVYAAQGETRKLVALDVGEGQAILLQRGRHGILFDSGHAGKACHVHDRLAARGIRQPFLAVVRPVYAIVSVNAGNIRDYPARKRWNAENE